MQLERKKTINFFTRFASRHTVSFFGFDVKTTTITWPWAKWKACYSFLSHIQFRFLQPQLLFVAVRWKKKCYNSTYRSQYTSPQKRWRLPSTVASRVGKVRKFSPTCRTWNKQWRSRVIENIHPDNLHFVIAGRQRVSMLN